MGVGMIAVVTASDTESVIEEIGSAGTEAFVCGDVTTGVGRVVLDGPR
jgi:phosphoribosylaminoimidazole (AIR) synthetase